MTFCLNTTIVKPEEENVIKNAVILLHGYGGDGKDISVLTLNWKRFLKNTIFLCPDGHEVCKINPIGFQWFDLENNDKLYILNEVKKAEDKLQKYIDEVKKQYSLKNSQICLSGFSQGCMMSINLGIISVEEFACVVGFSGKIIDKNDLVKRINSKPRTLLIHGEKDEIVPPNNLLESKDFFLRNNIELETMLIKDCDHHIPIEASSTALKFISDKFNI